MKIARNVYFWQLSVFRVKKIPFYLTKNVPRGALRVFLGIKITLNVKNVILIVFNVKILKIFVPRVLIILI
jgi:hypothetical protein